MSYGYASRYLHEDLSESDCSDGGQVTTDITELYRRKQQVATRGHLHYPGYYYEHQGRPCPCSFPLEPRYCCYKTAVAAAATPQEGVFHMSPPPKQGSLGATTAAAADRKKYPVTARTPRYYRCPAAPPCKRPSTLCLPVMCQPDPAAAATAAATVAATAHRPRKAATTDVLRRRAGPECDYQTRRKVDSEGDVTSRLNDLENLLTKFEDAAADAEDAADAEPVEIDGVSDLCKILKPKVPSSIKSKREKVMKLKVVKAASDEVPSATAHDNVRKLAVKEAPDEPLDVLLQRLSGEEEANAETKRGGGDEGVKTGSGEVSKARTVEVRSRPSHFEQKPSLDDNSALELHKSKSYIVSLIDKALSRELGTIPGTKCTRKEFLNMNPKRAIDLVNRHATPCMSDGTVGEDVVAEEASPLKKENFECKHEEPLYLKQLKQLRWSHLRHIQREAKRLADLERFLDSFGEIDDGS